MMAKEIDKNYIYSVYMLQLYKVAKLVNILFHEFYILKENRYVNAIA